MCVQFVFITPCLLARNVHTKACSGTTQPILIDKSRWELHIQPYALWFGYKKSHAPHRELMPRCILFRDVIFQKKTILSHSTAISQSHPPVWLFTKLIANPELSCRSSGGTMATSASCRIPVAAVLSSRKGDIYPLLGMNALAPTMEVLEPPQNILLVANQAAPCMAAWPKVGGLIQW